MKYLITVIGPTAIGKTALSIKLAQHFGCEIISADSRQFYREMSVGTAVPDSEELASAKHHFIQHKSIFDTYNVGDFEKDAISKLDELFSRNDYAVMVGGSGLYIDAILNGLDSFPDVPTEIRELVRGNYEKQGLSYLASEFEKHDPAYHRQLVSANPQTLQNPHRLMRFVEVSIASGRPYSSYLNQKQTPRNFIPVIIGLEADRDLMYGRINERVDQMISNGLVNEAKSVYLHKDLNALQTVGYRELFDHFDGKTTIEFAVSEIKKNTRRFAKRQLTWFKRKANAAWFDAATDQNQITQYIDEFINNRKQPF